MTAQRNRIYIENHELIGFVINAEASLPTSLTHHVSVYTMAWFVKRLLCVLKKQSLSEICGSTASRPVQPKILRCLEKY